MSNNKFNALLALGALILVSLACSGLKSSNRTLTNGIVKTTNTSSANTKTTANSSSEGETSSTEEKTKPAAGKGNVQGKVFYNDKPVEGIEVRICEEFSTIMGISCKGKTLTTKTDADGTFVLANLDPKEYKGLTAKVFKSDYYIYPQEGIMTPQKFTVVADKTIFARDINLFKDDLKVLNPKAGSKVAANGLEFKWEPYPDASYYRLSVYSDDGKTASPYVNERVDDASFSADKSFTNGRYRIKVEAVNANNHKLAESDSDIKFTVTGGEEPQPKTP